MELRRVSREQSESLPGLGCSRALNHAAPAAVSALSAFCNGKLRLELGPAGCFHNAGLLLRSRSPELCPSSSVWAWREAHRLLRALPPLQ